MLGDCCFLLIYLARKTKTSTSPPTAAKQFILYTIFCNVFLFPWGLSYIGTALGILGSIGALALKFLAVACVARDRAGADRSGLQAGLPRGVVLMDAGIRSKT